MIFNSLSTGLVAVLLPLAYALPAGPLDPLSESLQNITPREIQSAVQGLPACNTKETDPTWAVGKSAWNDGEGHYIGNDCNNGQKGDKNCWSVDFPL